MQVDCPPLLISDQVARVPHSRARASCPGGQCPHFRSKGSSQPRQPLPFCRCAGLCSAAPLHFLVRFPAFDPSQPRPFLFLSTIRALRAHPTLNVLSVIRPPNPPLLIPQSKSRTLTTCSPTHNTTILTIPMHIPTITVIYSTTPSRYAT